jgi:hypothetical protein
MLQQKARGWITMADFILVLAAVVLAVASTTLLFSKSPLMRN